MLWNVSIVYFLSTVFFTILLRSVTKVLHVSLCSWKIKMLYFFIQTRVSPSVSVLLSTSSYTQHLYKHITQTQVFCYLRNWIIIYSCSDTSDRAGINKLWTQISLTAGNRSVTTSAEVNKMRKWVKHGGVAFTMQWIKTNRTFMIADLQQWMWILAVLFPTQEQHMNFTCISSSTSHAALSAAASFSVMAS